MFLKNPIALVFAPLAVVVLIQLAYPSTRTRPLIKVNGRSAGLANYKTVAKIVEKQDSEEQSIKLAKKTYKTNAQAIGVQTKVDETSQSALEYSLPERLVPFSLFSNGSANKPTDKTIDEAKLNAYIAKLIAENTTPAQNPRISRTSSGEFQVKAGEDGSTYDEEALKRALMQIPLSDKQQLDLPATRQLEPEVSDEKANEVAAKLKTNEQDLQKLIDEWRADYPGAKSAVVFREIGGFGRIANANQDQSFFAASLYKLFVAHYVMNGIQSGTINPNGSIAGTTVSACFRAMIVVSDNPCPEAFANRYGWSAIDEFATKSGFGAANVEYGGNTVTAKVAADFLVKLANGQLADKTQTDTLLEYMGRQTYRSAIPAGLPGITVQDKPGFLGRTWHDAAIVRSKKATYALVVLSEGTGSGAIANLAKQIDVLLEPTF